MIALPRAACRRGAGRRVYHQRPNHDKSDTHLQLPVPSKKIGRPGARQTTVPRPCPSNETYSVASKTQHRCYQVKFSLKPAFVQRHRQVLTRKQFHQPRADPIVASSARGLSTNKSACFERTLFEWTKTRVKARYMCKILPKRGGM
jgi:hypothetical protein